MYMCFNRQWKQMALSVVERSTGAIIGAAVADAAGKINGVCS